MRSSAALRFGLFAVVLVAVSWLEAPPAAACSCVASTDAEATEHADTVFVGEYVRQESVADVGELLDSMQDLPLPARPVPAVRYLYSVIDVKKGDVAADQSVVALGSSSMCGMGRPEPGTVYVVFATRQASGELTSGLCDGNHPYTGPPPPAAGPDGSVSRTIAIWSDVAPPDPSSTTSGAWVVAGLITLVAIAGVGLWRGRVRPPVH